MIQLISHLFGDFLFQNDWMAEHKAKFTLKGWVACAVHCLVYTLFFYGQSTFFQLAFIFISHFVIDKFRAAYYWCELFRVGARLDPTNWIKVYLVFMVDMALHLATNFMIFKYL